MKKLNWSKQKTTIIRRVFERGNMAEKNAIIQFYGQATVDEALNKSIMNTYRLHK
ncbi:DUF6922 domain-containing protein [Paraflavitalea speifideaquila]|uniref:DUF6922 domain-containing protein n=1 Tax=Paraflavitalea speifideaquila TaxID=3076558 RepID=UPI0028F08AE7|nr:hypothetical protein [Paraflavitalea speifideiaquila]